MWGKPEVGSDTVVNEGTTRAVPPDVVDRLLWRDAQAILTCHHAAQPPKHGAHHGTTTEPAPTCVNCGHAWPCPPRRLAERAQSAAFGSWNAAWTARHDLRAVSAWRLDLQSRAPWPGSLPERPPGGDRQPGARNSGSFDPRTLHPR